MCDEIRQCAKCLVIKTIFDFGLWNLTVDGLDYVCRECKHIEQFKEDSLPPKRCPRCKETLESGHFTPRFTRSGTRILASRCRVCDYERVLEKQTVRWKRTVVFWEEFLTVPTHRYCPRCDLLKLIEEFPRNSTMFNRLGGYCRICQSKEVVKIAQNDPDKHNARARKNYHKDVVKSRVKAIERNTRRLTVPGTREKDNARERANHAKDPSKRRARGHRRRVNEGKVLEAETIRLLLAHYTKCLCCGSTDKLCVDHIIPVNKGGTNDPMNLQILCRSCNSRKCDRNSNDYRPHPVYPWWDDDTKTLTVTV